MGIWQVSVYFQTHSSSTENKTFQSSQEGQIEWQANSSLSNKVAICDALNF